MNKSIRIFLLLLSGVLLLTGHPILSSTPASQDKSRDSAVAEARPRELSGFLDDQRAETQVAIPTEHDIGYNGEPYPVPALSALPVLDTALSTKVRDLNGDEILRVILHLDYLPHAEVFEAVTDLYKAEMDELDADRQAFMVSQAAKRDVKAKIDAENYASAFRMDDSERKMMRQIADRHETLSTRIKDQVSAELKTLLDVNQAPVIEAITRLGGNVEFTTIAANLVVATVPADIVNELPKIPGVMRIVEDSLMEGHLTNADNATMVDPTDVSLLGLWDNGEDGGAYDPAIIDSGLDLNHPGMKNSVAPLRTNFGTWYLVAANGSAAFNDVFSQDDLQGHGTPVAGIVGSYGAPGFTTHLGMSYGVDKLVNLKAGWRNTSGGASMFWSDKYNVVDRALYNTTQLQGGNFADDVDGMNLSFGGSTSLDDTDAGRFWDSVIATYSDLPVTISAGNSGPSNTLFTDPAVSYNAIAVGYYNDRGTTSLTDDIVNAATTKGPTAAGRRKPDISAPGTSISAPNHLWETGADYLNKSGSSYAPPMVLGVIMALADAGVIDNVQVKALLINTAQKNRPSMNFENDVDGWDPALGFGVMNAYAAYFHRFDLFVDNVTPRNTADDFQLYRGTMRDEGAAGEGRDRVTMVWERPATYATAASPSTFYDLNNINLRLYQEDNNALLDFDTDVDDNVHQVRIAAGAGDTPVVVNAYAWDTVYDNGAASQSFAIATEEGFERVDHPGSFQGIAIWPTEVEPNEVFDIEFWLRNDSMLASHNNQYDLSLPAGWTLVAGIDTQNVGAIASGGDSAHVFYTLRAPPTIVGAQTLVVAHSHNSYNEPYGSFNWNINLTVAVDNTAPNPNPMTFSEIPNDQSTSETVMTASSAFDIHSPVEYYLDYTSTPSGGPGGTDSVWQASRSYTDGGLGTNHKYCYRAWARDNAATPNLTIPSANSCVYTSQQTPAGVSVGAVTNTSIQVAASSTPPNLTLELSGLLLGNTTTGTNSGWQQSNTPWTSLGLTPAAGYDFVATARNGDGDASANSPVRRVYTLANFPAVDGLFTESATEIKVVINPNGNSPAAEYLVQNTTAGTNSGWINDTSWVSGGLPCETFHNFQARARNGDGIETLIVPFGQQITGLCGDADGDGVEDADDNCLLESNADQRDTDNDGIGNVCDPDVAAIPDCFVNFADLNVYQANFFVAGDLDTDNNGDGFTNFVDLNVIKAYFFQQPGPSADGCN